MPIHFYEFSSCNVTTLTTTLTIQLSIILVYIYIYFNKSDKISNLNQELRFVGYEVTDVCVIYVIGCYPLSDYV